MTDPRNALPDEPTWNQPNSPAPAWGPPQPPPGPPPPGPTGPPGPPPAGMRPPGPTVGAWVPPGAGQPVSARPGPPPGRPTNTLAIAALVASFVCGPAGLIMGILARQQIRQRNEAGDGLALAAIIVGSVNLALSLLIGCVVASADTGTTY